jgi:hypothetical protein
MYVGEPNFQLRRARERVESPFASGKGLTRRELADLINRWMQERKGRTSGVEDTYIGKLEQGAIRWPQDPDRRQAFREVLGVSTDAALGFRRPRRSRPMPADVPPHQSIRPGVDMAAWASHNSSVSTELITPRQPTPIPSMVGIAQVEEVRAAAAVFGGWDALYGGGLVREAVAAQLRYCVGLLNARYSANVRAELFSAVGYLGHVTAFMAFDAYAHDDARRLFEFALFCADEAADWHLRAKVLSSMARQAIWCDDPDVDPRGADDGLTYIELALVRADRLTATERAMLHTARARALAKLGRIQDTAAAVGAADEAFSNSRPVNDPPWMKYYDAAQHAGDTGHALWDTAVAGHFGTDARARLALAAAGHDDGHARARTISQTKLASLVMVTGDPVEAAVLGGQALEWSGSIRSRRAADDLRELRRMATPHETINAVAELTRRIGTTVVV